MFESQSSLAKLEQILANCESIERGFRALQEKLDAMPESDFAAKMRDGNRDSLAKAEQQVRIARDAVKRERSRTGQAFPLA